jgi:FlaA1/EpsC-like NDP-sugar epimerase
MDYMKNKRILITGACGTVGSELVRLLLTDSTYQPGEVIGLDNNESELFFLDQKYLSDDRAFFIMGDIRDQAKLDRVMQDIDIVFHAAAKKHVILCERSPFEAVQTNIQGVQNIILAAQKNKVGKVVFTSSDKAVNPTNVMGTSKLMGERIITAANSNSRERSTIFSSTRFGNVLGSNGSVIPIFRQQIKKGGPVTLTDPEMTRFVMTIEESVRLVIGSARLARGGEVFITKMPVIRITDLAQVMIEELAPRYGHDSKNISIEIIGCKPGEKLYEELMSQEETSRTLELPRYFAVLPAFRGFYKSVNYEYDDIVTDKVDDPYVSAEVTPLSIDELRTFLHENRLLEVAEQDEIDQRYWPGDKEEQTR